MNIQRLHSWAVSAPQAAAIQERLAPQVVRVDRLGETRYIAGVDVGFDKPQGTCRAAVAVLDAANHELCDQAEAILASRFPYVPGLLSFRELPVVLEALGRLRLVPDVVLCDAQGIAHPRRFGLACHLGVVVDVPTIGVAKSRLLGTHRRVPEERGAWVPLWDQGERIGAVLRTRRRVRPVFVSIGNRVSLETAVELTLRAAPRYRLPEAIRWAHRLSSRGAG